VSGDAPKRYVVHIGPMKTASTYLQQCLRAARPRLLAQGVYYPTEFIAENNKFMHMQLHYALLRERVRELQKGFAAINASGAHTIVLSCEHLMFQREVGYELLRELTEGATVDIVYFSRRWSDRYASIWNQTLLMGGSQTFPEFFMSMLSGHPPNFYPRKAREAGLQLDFDYAIIWRMVAQIFGRESLTIFPYSTIVDEGGDVYEVFCKTVLGLAEAPKVTLAGEKLWVSMPTEDAEILRTLNEMYFRATAEQDGALRTAFHKERKRIDVDAVVAAMQTSLTETEIDDNAPYFDLPYSRMSEFRERVIGGGEVFARKAKNIRHFRSGYLLADGAREALQSLYARLAPGLTNTEGDSFAKD
jgi:hypothetical protein